MEGNYIEYKDLGVYWDGHASIRVVDNGFTVAVDPFKSVSPDFDPNLILITHEDAGHYDPKMLEKLCSESTCVVLPRSMEDVDVPCKDIEYVEADEMIEIFGVRIESVPMYNEYHERGKGFGYRFEMANNSIYVAGDTGLIDEIVGA